MNFKCPKCHNIFKRDGRTKIIKGNKFIISCCGDIPVVCMRMK